MDTHLPRGVAWTVSRDELARIAADLVKLRTKLLEIAMPDTCKARVGESLSGIASTLDRAINAPQAQETSNAPAPMRRGEPAPDLTCREREILMWIARGKSNSVIAEILKISPHTVDTHLRRAYRKLGAHDRTTAAIGAMRLGMLDAAA